MSNSANRARSAGMALLGFASGEQHPFRPGYLLVKNVSAMGLQAGDYRDRLPGLMRSTMEELLAVTHGGVGGKAVNVTKANR